MPLISSAPSVVSHRPDPRAPSSMPHATTCTSCPPPSTSCMRYAPLPVQPYCRGSPASTSPCPSAARASAYGIRRMMAHHPVFRGRASGSSPPSTIPRTVLWMPSAPMSTSHSCAVPSAKRSVTGGPPAPPPPRSTPSSLLDACILPGGTTARSSPSSAPRCTVLTTRLPPAAESSTTSSIMTPSSPASGPCASMNRTPRWSTAPARAGHAAAEAPMRSRAERALRASPTAAPSSLNAAADSKMWTSRCACLSSAWARVAPARPPPEMATRMGGLWDMVGVVRDSD